MIGGYLSVIILFYLLDIDKVERKADLRESEYIKVPRPIVNFTSSQLKKKIIIIFDLVNVEGPSSLYNIGKRSSHVCRLCLTRAIRLQSPDMFSLSQLSQQMQFAHFVPLQNKFGGDVTQCPSLD